MYRPHKEVKFYDLTAEQEQAEEVDAIKQLTAAITLLTITIGVTNATKH
jgi:hypothetical protein